MGITGGKRRTRRSRGRFSRSRRVRPRIHPNMGSWGYTSSESMASMCENGRCRTRRWVNGREVPSRGMGRGRGPSSTCHSGPYHSGPSSRCRCGCGRRGCRCGWGRPSPFADTHTQGFPMGFSDGHFSSGMDLPRLFRLPWMGEQIKLVKLPSTESKVRKSTSSGVSSSRKSGRRSKRSQGSKKSKSKRSKRKVRRGSSSSRSVRNLRRRIRRTRR